MKKPLHIWISMFLTMLFVASLCTSVYADVDMTLALEKVGEIQEAKLDYKSIKVYPAGLITEDAEGNSMYSTRWEIIIWTEAMEKSNASRRNCSWCTTLKPGRIPAAS